MPSSSDPPPAYEFQRSPGGGGRTTPVHANHSSDAAGDGRVESFATTSEDSIDNSTLEPPLAENSETSALEDTILSADGDGEAPHGRVDVSQLTEYEGLGRSRGDSPSRGYDHGYQMDQEGYNIDGADGSGAEDVTETIRGMHRSLLELMSEPDLFHEGIEWQTKLESGVDPGAVSDGEVEKIEADPERYRRIESANDDDGGDSTFDGLDSVDDGNKNMMTMATEDETFEFDPDAVDKLAQEEKEPNEPPRKRKAEPLPLRIFAPDAEAVLPAAFTATQLFGAEVHTGIELEAAAGIVDVSKLFLRWLALMPEGDHANPVDPPGLTVMRIAGGGYRVTGAHRVVWRWMNVFGSDAYPSSRSPSTSGGESPSKTTASASDLGFGDLVTMTIVDVFETDSSGRLLSYCPTFDNRSVRETNENVERMRKTVTQVDDAVGAFVRSPAGKIASAAVGQAGRMSMRAAVVVGNAVRNQVRHNLMPGGEEGGDDGGELAGEESLVEASVSEEERLGELFRSQVTVDGDGTGEDADMSRLDGSAIVDEDGPRSAVV